MTHFQLFAYFGQTILVRKIGKNPKLNSNDQVGSRPCVHAKFSSATRCKVSAGQKTSRKTDFQSVK